ncbi:MAG: UDP-glucose--hexose-1-phosphate uridylyltransferase [Lachnospiraceae bacterium]|nr:UDP-glucose--hexose-1-phosphate uridylyltransferase [Lachnospiraceae bacterium]
MNIYAEIQKLVEYGLQKGLIQPEDKIYTINRYLELFEQDDFEEQDIAGQPIVLEEILENLMQIAFEAGIMKSDDIVTKDLFDTKLMGILTPAPSTVIKEFRAQYAEDPKKATDAFYAFSQDNNYIRRERIKKDRKWQVDSPYGKIDITINLSKPEKDPKAIAAAKNAKQSAYPKCQLCIENEGYAGRMNHPARQNHRIIPIQINGGQWGFQYSPYVYYNEHCIVFNGEHVPMKIDKNAFIKLFDFVKQFPHYFLGSNADLPIVGGSILSHDHFQGGNYEFAMAKAPYEETFTIPGYEDVEAGIVFWPLSVIRIRHKEPERLIELADHILGKWRGYTDEAAVIYAETDGEPHNTITPIARKKGEVYELDLALRNNITTEDCPLGLYHPHAEYHHIKKENIGLIEVMGLAVLPARLKGEMELLGEYLVQGKDVNEEESLQKHAEWTKEILAKYSEKGTAITAENVSEILQEEIGQVFVHVLEDAGVYKTTPEGREAFRRFISVL